MLVDFKKFVVNKLIGYLDDVNITDVQDNHVLTYITDKWVNKYLPEVDDFSDKYFNNTSKTSSSETYINHTTYNNANNGVVGDYVIGIKFMYSISSSSDYLQYRIKINDVVVDEVKLYSADADGVFTNDYEYKHTTSVKDENIKVELDFLVEQPFFGSTSGAIVKSIISKRPL